MRISSLTFYATTQTGLRDQQIAISRLSQQIATNQRMLAPKDDPVSTTRVLALSESIAANEQFQANQVKADLALKHEETVLAALDGVLRSIRKVIGDTRADQTQSLRDQSAATLAGLYKQVRDLANSRDSSGDYIFAGFATATKPYDHVAVFDPASGGPADSPDSAYLGDAGARRVEISGGRYVRVNDDLSAVMQAGGAGDLLEAIDQAAIDLGDAVTAPATLQTSLDASFSVVDTALSRLQAIRTSVAGRGLEIADVRTVTNQFLLNDRNALSDLTLLDQAAAIIELQQRQVTLQAAGSTFSLTSRLSLFNYLS